MKVKVRLKIWHKIFLIFSLFSGVLISLVLGFQTGDTWNHLLSERQNDSLYRHNVIIETAKIEESKGRKKIENLFSAQVENGNKFAIISDEMVVFATFSLNDNIKKRINQDINQDLAVMEDSYMYIFSCEELLGDKYYIVSQYLVSDLYDFFINQLIKTAVLFALTQIAVMAVSFFVLKKMFEPIELVQKKVKSIAEGDYGQRINSKKFDEIGDLSNNVDEMAETIQNRIIQIEEESESRKLFIADLSHELKTPLTTIMGYGDLIRIKRNLEEESRIKYGSLIVSESKRLKSLSDKLMQLINVENMDKSSFRRCDVNVLLHEVKDFLQPSLTAKEIKLNMACEELELLLDEDLFKSMVVNFVDNAVKASWANQEIKVYCKGDNENFSLCVEDFGIGIPQDEIKKITDPFYMVDKSRSRKSGGAGIGLALCNKIAALHGGHIYVESELGEGARVYFTIP